MKKTDFKEVQERSAFLIDSAGLAAVSAVGTDDFLPRFSTLLDTFRKEYAAYLYAVRKIDPFDPRLSEEDNSFYERALEEVSTYFSTAAEVITADFVRRFDPSKAKGALPFFDFLNYIVKKRADAAFSAEQIANTRRGMTGLTREQSRLLSAALRAFESVCEVTDEILVATAKQIGCDPELLRDAWIMNRNSNAESLDAGEENDEGDFISLYDKVAADDRPKENTDFIEDALLTLDTLLSYERPAGFKKSDAPFELSKTEKLRFPLLFTNRLILGWVDELKTSDPDAANRADILSHRFDDLRLEKKQKKYSKYRVISPLVFELYEKTHSEVTLGMLAALEGVDQSGFSGIEDSVARKLALYKLYKNKA